MKINHLILVAFAASLLADAAHPQETPSYVAGTSKEGFKRFVSLCRDQEAACDAAFRFGALVGADAADRCASASDRITCFKQTINNPAFVEEEQQAIIAHDGLNHDPAN
jgi:hypothetical protein